jgi:ketosteroid isomerase-like protein
MKKAEQVLKNYFQHLYDPELALQFVHKDAKFIAAKEHTSDKHHFYGTYHGVDGVRKLLSKFAEDLDTQVFTIHKMLGDEDTVFAWGRFEHRIRPTNRLFVSDWAVVVQIEDEKIKFFQGFEDTAGLEEAFRMI